MNREMREGLNSISSVQMQSIRNEPVTAKKTHWVLFVFESSWYVLAFPAILPILPVPDSPFLVVIFSDEPPMETEAVPGFCRLAGDGLRPPWVNFSARGLDN